MPIILALETATNACSVALFDGSHMHSEHVVAPREHSDRILGMITAVFASASLSLADVDAIAFGQGPGSFLGTRIAAGVAQALGFAHNCPVIPVCTLQALADEAKQITDCQQCVVGWDARMSSIYWASYRSVSGVMELSDSASVSAPQDLNPKLTEGVDTVWAGNAWTVYESELSEPVGDQIAKQPSMLTEIYPNAVYLIRSALKAWEVGAVTPPAEAQPIYLRDPV